MSNFEENSDKDELLQAQSLAEGFGAQEDGEVEFQAEEGFHFEGEDDDMEFQFEF